MKRRDLLTGAAALAVAGPALARKSAPDFMPIVRDKMVTYLPYYEERELTEPTVLLDESGLLNPQAIGWSRRPLVRANLHGHRLRKKRWNFWNFITRDFVLSATIADIDYASFCAVDLTDFGTKKSFSAMAIGRGGSIAMPEEVEKSIAWQKGGVSAVFDHFGTGIKVSLLCPKMKGGPGQGEFTISKPAGHETLNIVAPWSRERFQLNSKHNTLPVEGEFRVGSRAYRMKPEECHAVQDFGRGVWPYRSYWNWGVLSGVQDGVRIGVNMGAKWTTGTGASENGICCDGKLFKVMEDLTWEYNPSAWNQPWRMRTTHSDMIDLTLTPLVVRDTTLSIGFVGTGGVCAFGHYNGKLRFDGRTMEVRDLIGWGEEFSHRW